MSDGTHMKYCKSIWVQLWIWVSFSISWFSVMMGSTAHTCLLEVTKNPENGAHISSLKESGFQQVSCPQSLACPRNPHHHPSWAAAHHSSCKHQNKIKPQFPWEKDSEFFSPPPKRSACCPKAFCLCVCLMRQTVKLSQAGNWNPFGFLDLLSFSYWKVICLIEAYCREACI